MAHLPAKDNMMSTSDYAYGYLRAVLDMEQKKKDEEEGQE